MSQSEVDVTVHGYREQIAEWKCVDPESLCLPPPQIEGFEEKDMSAIAAQEYNPAQPPAAPDSEAPVTGPRVVNIMVMGQYGAGKSSFINSLATALKNDKKFHSMCNVSSGVQHFTRWAARVPIYQDRKKQLVIWDTWGISPENYLNEEYLWFLEGAVYNGYFWERNKTFPRYWNTMHIVFMVIPATAVTPENTQLQEKWYRAYHSILKKGYQPVIIMTKADSASSGDCDPRLIAHPLLVRKDPAVRAVARKLAKLIGAPSSLVLPFVNYGSHESLNTINAELDALALEAVLKALQIADDRLVRIQQLRRFKAIATPSTAAAPKRAQANAGPSRKLLAAQGLSAVLVDYEDGEQNFMDAESAPDV